MTPDCCTQAWAKATGHEVFEHEGMWAYSKGERLIKDDWGVPTPTSAEWLAEITEASEIFKFANEGRYGIRTEFFLAEKWHNGRAPDLRRAICAALNGTPCERKAA